MIREVLPKHDRLIYNRVHHVKRTLVTIYKISIAPAPRVAPRMFCAMANQLRCTGFMAPGRIADVACHVRLAALSKARLSFCYIIFLKQLPCAGSNFCALIRKLLYTSKATRLDHNIRSYLTNVRFHNPSVLPHPLCP